jgi:hypothetical protein
MATILFAAAGAALGSTLGGTILGLSGAVVGRAVGATVGRAVDQRIIGGGSDAVEVGRIDRLRLTGASQGASVAQVWGRMRVSGQVVWASDFSESRTRRGGKGMPSQRVTEYSYTVSLAIALCEGEILGVGRIWADGAEIQPVTITMRTYTGTETQIPDPVIEAQEGAELAPAYRGIAYVVIESLDLSAFGNRIPQFSFEVMRSSSGSVVGRVKDLQEAIQAVAIMPGTGEYAYAVEKQNIASQFDFLRTVNVNSPSGKSDFSTSVDQLQMELPRCKAASLVVSWFGSDLRCENCSVQPKVEQRERDSISVPWHAGGISRDEAIEIERLGGRSIYGGTPADSAVIEAIREITGRGIEVMFYPFVLMDQLDGNTLQNPYSDTLGQPKLPWRGRITLSIAPGREGSPDTTSEAERQVNVFFGSAQISDFQISDSELFYLGAQEWGYRRFVLHYAFLCKLAGGVEAFCVGSELRGLTSIRGIENTFPAVNHLLALLNDVRLVLGPNVKLSYAADWSEYFGYHVENEVFFNLDLLWASPNVDFVGIDYYVPLSDWRHTLENKDSRWKSHYDIDYIKANILGGEGFDWYYTDPTSEERQVRTAIKDEEWSEDWIFRPKDILSWWSNYHYERVGGIRASSPTSWRPGSKPYRFTEYGCAAVDLGANQPNKFFDANSSESSFPRGSLGIRDDLMQMQFFRAMAEFWGNQENNPISSLYDGRMLDQGHCYAWAWDARPFPDFPRNEALWSDGKNYHLGHWLNGRVSSVPLDSLLIEICYKAGGFTGDAKNAYGCIKGFSVSSIETARSKIQPLSQLYSFDCIDCEGQLSFISRSASDTVEINGSDLLFNGTGSGSVEVSRGPLAGVPSSVRLSFIEFEGDFSTNVVEVSVASERCDGAIDTEFPILLENSEAKMIASRWLAELRTSNNTISFALPLSLMNVVPSTIVNIDGLTYRSDRVEQGEYISVEATEVDQSHYRNFRVDMERPSWRAFKADGPIQSLWMELPFFRQNQSPVAPFLALGAHRFRGPAVLWSSIDDSDYQVNRIFNTASFFGRTETNLLSCQPGLLDRGDELLVRMSDAPFSSISPLKLLGGGNLIAIGDGTSKNWEIFQFQNAELYSSGLWGLSNRLRGQFGTNSKNAESWPVGSFVVFLDENIMQADISDDFVGLDLHFRLGFNSYGLSDANTSYSIRSFDGLGLRPFKVCHLRLLRIADLAHEFSWIRRSRFGGDSWESFEIPLAEEVEQYSVRILRSDGVLVRYQIVKSPFFRYDYDLRVADANLASYKFEVCQISNSVGMGDKSEILVE